MQTTVQVINLTGNVTLNGLSSIVEELTNALEAGTSIMVSFSAATDIDLAAIQVLLAAKAEAQNRNVELSLSGSVNSTIAQRFATAGFISRVVDQGKELDEELFRTEPQNV